MTATTTSIAPFLHNTRFLLVNSKERRENENQNGILMVDDVLDADAGR